MTNPMENRQPWPQLLAKLSLVFGPDEFDTYLKSARLKAWEDQDLTLEALDPFRRDWILQHRGKIEETLRSATSRPQLKVQVVTPQPEILKEKLVVAERLVL